MIAESVIAQQALLQMLNTTDNPDEIMRFLPRWQTVDRVKYLINGYKEGWLTPLEIAELDAVLEIVPAIRQMRQTAH